MGNELDTVIQPKKDFVGISLFKGIIWLGMAAPLVLLLLFLRPWEDDFPTRTASEYWGLGSLCFWAASPYLPLLIKARKLLAVQAGNLVRLIGAAIICLGGVGLYLDAFFRCPEPLNILIFLAVPPYQWMGVALLLVLDFFFTRRNSTPSR
jgi:hypothetical protein